MITEFRNVRVDPYTCWLMISLAICWPAQLSAHELWLEPTNYEIQLNQTLAVSIRNGEDFKGSALPFVPTAFKRISLEDNEGEHTVNGVLGDLPAIHQLPDNTGLHILRYESVKNVLNYPHFEKFAQFADKEGVEWVLPEHRAKYSQKEPVREVFRRFAKTLISVEGATGRDNAAGMELELVAIDNPYLASNKSTLQLQLLYQGQPLSGAQITAYSRPATAQVQRSVVYTDTQGMAAIPRIVNQDYLVNAVHIRAPSLIERLLNGTHWETLWASTTFRIPSPDSDQSAVANSTVFLKNVLIF